MHDELLGMFHPAVRGWFVDTFGAPTEPQTKSWPAIRAGRHTLVAAPTGSGKTLCAFLSAIDDLVRRAERGELEERTYVLYVSPLKALSNDIEKNLEAPLAGIASRVAQPLRIVTSVRTGDTPSSRRAKQTQKPPHIFVTTPESLYILLTSAGGRRLLQHVRTVIVDEIHAVVASKRGSHLALSLERLEALVKASGGSRVQRIGLSATQRPIDEVARFLVGARNVDAAGVPDCTIVDGGHRRQLDLRIEVPGSPMETVLSGDVWEELYDRLAELISTHRTTLVFVNTRRLAERLTRHLSSRIGEHLVTSHHGSLAKEHRLAAEQRLKAGSLKALVATASLELGIDIGDVDLVCQVGMTRSIAAFLQRVGRSGHHLAGVPRGRLFPLSRDELCEAAALLDAIGRGELDALAVVDAPLDIVAQQMVAALAVEEWTEDELYELVRGAWPYRNLAREAYDKVVRMLADGFATARGRRSAHIHHDAVNQRMRGRRGAALTAITSGGAIPDTADYDVLLDPAAIRIGSLNEDYAIESNAGDIFQLGNMSYRILRVEAGAVRVEDAHGEPPNIPFWLGEAPARTPELSHSVSRLRETIAARLDQGAPAALAYLADIGVAEPAARQIVDYLDIVRTTLGVVPSHSTLVIERFFDETGGMHVVLHAPFGSRVNRAWGLALRKRFCRTFNFELQAAATEDAIILSLGPTHSFELSDVWSFLKSGNVREVLVQALLDAPMFTLRWRWNATRALSVLRFRKGKKVPPKFQRMDSDDLLTVCFPEQVACLENIVGDREVPDHPLVQQTVADCLVEAMDIEGLEALLRDMEQGKITLLARDLTEPSPLASDVLNARPYAYLDDAPLEERRTQAVRSRRWLDPASASDLGALDESAIARVREEAWPEPRDADELHDALVLFGWFEDAEVGAWRALLASLEAAGRAGRVAGLWVAAERADQLRALHPDLALVTPRALARAWDRDDAIVELVRGRLEAVGPITAARLATSLGVAVDEIDAALVRLETEGFVFRGTFTREANGAREWCERRLLARIHRYTLGRLRREIEPVPAADFLRFLFRWQHVDRQSQVAGPEGLAAAVAQLEGFECAAAAWEKDVLPARCRDYAPSYLDSLCLSGKIAWARRSPAPSARSPIRTTPIALMARAALPQWLGVSEPIAADPLSEPAALVLSSLRNEGASFFEDLVARTDIARPRLEEALGELVSRGLVTSDGFAGLRALITPAARRRTGLDSAGRWSSAASRACDDEALVAFAWQLLRRWGVIFRRLLDREGPLPPWRDLLRVYRKLEARGEIRGGRFVAGFTGEQYALPEAVGLLRSLRREGEKTRGQLVYVSATDPLNLVGIITTGARVPAAPRTRIVYLDGEPIAVAEGDNIRRLDHGDAKVDVAAVLAKRRPQLHALPA